MTTEETATALDGRRQRTERSRQLIVDAMLGLIEEGILVPTAQQVSERAGVGIRTVFRHFSDMESLFVTADAQIRVLYQKLFEDGDREGTLEQRLQHAVKQYGIGYEAVGNQFLSTKAQLWHYQGLKQQYGLAQRQLRKELEDWLPELQAMSPDQREMVDAVASFETWHRLRELQGLSIADSSRLVADLLHRIIFDK